MDQGALNRLLDKGFELWQKIVGHNPHAKSIKGHEWPIYKQAEELQRARQLDPSGVTAFMLLKAFSEQYIADEKISALDLIVGLSDKQKNRLDALRGLHDFLQQPEVDLIVDKFIVSVRAATKHYGIDHKDLESWLESYYWMAILRRDALRSFEDLEVHQFFHGTPGSKPVAYNTKITEFWNIPSLVRAMQAQGLHGSRGISLCLIRDPEEALHSFFVLSVVNGESITILTDRDKRPHPMAKSMSRRPDKSFVERAEKQWFPYELLKFKISEDQRRIFAESREAIVPINVQAVEISDFSKLHPADAIWLSLLFELICGEYLEENSALLETSYTTEMVKQPLLLLAARKPTSIVTNQHHHLYKPLEAKELTREDVTAQTTKDQWDRDPVGHNEWMIERYGQQVPEKVLNVFGISECNEAEAIIGVNQDLYRRDENSRVLRNLDPLSFGSAITIQHDRLWTARYNQCQVIQHLAHKEYEETHKEVREWLNDHIRSNRDWIIEKGVQGHLVVKALLARHDVHFTGDPPKVQKKDLVSVIIGGRPHQNKWDVLPYPNVSLSPVDEKHREYVCAITGARSTSYHVRIHPVDPKSIALLANCSVEELPWQLQRWTYEESPQYTGNSILERLDPSDWVLENPWCQWTRFKIHVIFSLSKRAVNRMRKELALPAVDWTASSQSGEY